MITAWMILVLLSVKDSAVAATGQINLCQEEDQASEKQDALLLPHLFNLGQHVAPKIEVGLPVSIKAIRTVLEATLLLR